MVAEKTIRLAERARWDDVADRQLTMELYFDLFFLSNSYRFNLDRALKKLVEMVRDS